MPTRAEKSRERRRVHAEAQIAEQPTDRGRFWKTCAWLLVEGGQVAQLEQVTSLVRTVIDLIREGIDVERIHDRIRH
ncbi:hypothetical protein [Dactylosporangium sp. CA-139066]|uniref:hypothetical protein n=1 Tax=Dactylosporangium sp. CA-139066 TaxID=3239930 RepID=UPI003D932B2C